LQNEGRDLKGAQATYERARGLWQSLAREGQGSEALAQEGRILHDLAALQHQAGRAKEAEAARRQALAMRERALYGQARDALDSLARTYSDLGTQLCLSGRRDEGLSLLERAIECRAKLAEVYGDSAEYLWLLAEAHVNLARVQANEEKYDLALA